MAILAMNRISIAGLKSERKEVLETLQRLGTIEIQDFVEEDDVFRKSRMPISASEFDRSIHDAENALEVLTTYDQEKPGGILSSFKGRDVIEKSQYDAFEDEYPEVSDAVSRILALAKEIAEKKAEAVKCSQQIEMLEPWKDLDVDLDLSGTESTGIFIGALPGEWTLDGIYEALAEQLPVDVDIISKTKDQTCVMVVCGKENQPGVNSALRGIGFVYPSVSCSNTPVKEKERLQGEIERLEGEVKVCEDEILSYDPMKSKIKFLADYQAIRSEEYDVASSLPQSEHAFVLSGFAPAKSIPKIEKALKDYSVCVEASPLEKGDDAPVLLKNNPFAATVEGVVSAFSLPGKGEIDPSFIISLFYACFFGFMLSDAAIGFLLFAGALFLLLKNKNMERSLKNNVRLFMCGGIFAMFWGVMFGSYFGDMLPTISREFFGHEILVKPVWLDMTKNPMTVLTLCLGFGLLHIFTGMAIAGYQMLREKDYAGFIFDVVCWYVILIGLLMKCFSMQMIMDILFSGKEPFLSAQVGNIGLYMAAAGAVVVIFTAGRSSKNIGKRLLKGIYAVYGITGYLSDLLSYSRLLALGLATGVISSVANMIGTMFGTGVFGVIVYIIVFVIINFINIGINTLGAYVHTNRLQYVEFFGRFYNGGGRPFQPFSINTKYYKFKENENND